MADAPGAPASRVSGETSNSRCTRPGLWRLRRAAVRRDIWRTGRPSATDTMRAAAYQFSVEHDGLGIPPREARLMVSSGELSAAPVVAASRRASRAPGRPNRPLRRRKNEPAEPIDLRAGDDVAAARPSAGAGDQGRRVRAQRGVHHRIVIVEERPTCHNCQILLGRGRGRGDAVRRAARGAVRSRPSRAVRPAMRLPSEAEADELPHADLSEHEEAAAAAGCNALQHAEEAAADGEHEQPGRRPGRHVRELGARRTSAMDQERRRDDRGEEHREHAGEGLSHSPPRGATPTRSIPGTVPVRARPTSPRSGGRCDDGSPGARASGPRNSSVTASPRVDRAVEREVPMFTSTSPASDDERQAVAAQAWARDRDQGDRGHGPSERHHLRRDEREDGAQRRAELTDGVPPTTAAGSAHVTVR